MNPIPEGYKTVTPYITVKGAKAFISFLKNAFQAEVIEITEGADGTIFNAEVRVGSSMILTADARDQAPSPSTIYMYLSDPDAVYERAVAAGAQSLCPMMEMPYGDRAGGVKDSWGNQWWMAKRVKRVSPEEVARLMGERSK